MKKWVVFLLLIFLFSKNVLAATQSGTSKPLITSSGSLTCDNYCIRYYRASDASCSWFGMCPIGYESTRSSYGCGLFRTCCCKRGDYPPSVSISHSPETVREGTIVTYTATATDDYNLKSIEIFVDGKSANKCYVSGTSNSCVATGGPYPVGSNHNYHALVFDDANQVATSEIKSFSVFYTPGGTCVRANPNLWIEPTYQSASAGTKVTYTLRIKNNDNNYCNASRFYIFMSGYPSNWNLNLAQDFVSIQPGSEAVTYLFVTSSPTTSPQNYSFSVIVKNYEAAQYTTTSVANYEVKPSRAPPTVYGNYTIYPKSGVTDGWISLEIRDREGKIVDTLYISKGETVFSNKINLAITLISVIATSDNIVTSYELKISPINISCTGSLSITLECRKSYGNCNFKGTLTALNCKDQIFEIREDNCFGALLVHDINPIDSINFTRDFSGDLLPGSHNLVLCINGVAKSSVSLSCDSSLQPCCIDSDNGLNYYTKGTCKDRIGPTTEVTDFCGSGQWANIVYEHACNNQDDCYEDTYICPYGCKDGACLTTPTTTTILATCNETDGGNKPLVKGITTDLYGSEIDVCTSSNNLREWYCSGNYKYSASIDCNINCQYLGYNSGYCAEGACKCLTANITTTTTILPTTTSTTTTTTSSTTTTTLKPTTTTLPACDENTCYNNCLARGNIDGYCSGNQCICVPKTGGPIPAGILGSLWDFIKSLLGIQ
jgi:hypothetical protein